MNRIEGLYDDFTVAHPDEQNKIIGRLIDNGEFNILLRFGTQIALEKGSEGATEFCEQVERLMP